MQLEASREQSRAGAPSSASPWSWANFRRAFLKQLAAVIILTVIGAGLSAAIRPFELPGFIGMENPLAWLLRTIFRA